SKAYTLPVFYEQLKRSHFIDLFLKEPQKTHWKIKSKPGFVDLNTGQGTLSKTHSMERLHVSIDWKKWQNNSAPEQASFTIQIGKENYPITLELKSLDLPTNTADHLFIADNGVVVMYGENYTRKTSTSAFHWEEISGLGHSGAVMQASPAQGMPIDTLQLAETAPVLSYDIFIEELPKQQSSLILNALPTHPITNQHSVRMGVQWNNGPMEIIDFRT